ncbi:MAG: hypothetical protein ABWX65_02905 [Mycetocola sp.]
MVSDDKTPTEPGGDGSRPEDAHGQQPDAQGAGQPQAGQDPNAQAPYTQGHDAGQNPYGQNQPAAQNPYSPGQPANGHDTGAQNPYGQNQPAAQNPYSQGQAPTDGYNQGAQAAGAYTQGAYSQGAQQGNQGGYAPGAYPQNSSPAGYPPQPGYPQANAAPRTPMDPKKKKRIILFSALAAGLVLLLIIGSVVINVVNSTQYGPEATVRSYLTAISQGKASQANKLVDPGVTKNAAALLSDDVLGEAKAFMKNAKVTKVSTRGDSAYAEVSYSVDGTAFDDVLELSKDGKQGLFFDKWKLDKPLLASVYVYTSQGTTVSVNGTDVDFGKEYELAAYPASYEIGAPTGDFFEAEAQTFVAGTGSKASYEAIDVELTPSEGLTDAVQEALNAHLDECATSTKDDPEGCGMYTGATYDFSSEPTMKYKVEKYPVVTVDESGRYFTTEGGKVTATATGTLYGGGSGTESYTTGDDWNLDGSIVIEEDEVTLEDIY